MRFWGAFPSGEQDHACGAMVDLKFEGEARHQVREDLLIGTEFKPQEADSGGLLLAEAS